MIAPAAAPPVPKIRSRSTTCKVPDLPWLAEPPRKRGRPVVSEDAVQRARHIECAGLMLITNWPVKRIAASLGISRATAYLWYDLALSYNGSQSEALRKMAAKR